MKNIRAMLFIMMIVQASAAIADEQTRVVWGDGQTTADAACQDTFGSSDVNLMCAILQEHITGFSVVTTLSSETTGTCKVVCLYSANGSDGEYAGPSAAVSSSVEQIPHEHEEEEPSLCEAGAGVFATTTYTGSLPPPSEYCTAGCVSAVTSSSCGGPDDNATCSVNLITTALECSGEGTGSADDGTEEPGCTGDYYTNSAGEQVCVTGGTTDSGTGTDTSGTTDTTGTDTAGTDTAGTDTAGTDTAGTDTAGTDTAGTETSGDTAGGTTGSGDAGTGGVTAGSSDGGGEVDDCPTNQYQLVAGELVCTDGVVGDNDTEAVSGGTTCENKPICGGSVVNCAIVYQAWAGRCESQELKDDLLTEVDEDIFTSSAPAQVIDESIASFSAEITEITGSRTDAIVAATEISDNSIMSRIPNSSGTFAFMNVEVMGQSLNMGDKMDSAWAYFRPVLGFGIWSITAMGIYMMWFGAIGSLKP